MAILPWFFRNGTLEPDAKDNALPDNSTEFKYIYIQVGDKLFYVPILKKDLQYYKQIEKKSLPARIAFYNNINGTTNNVETKTLFKEGELVYKYILTEDNKTTPQQAARKRKEQKPPLTKEEQEILALNSIEDQTLLLLSLKKIIDLKNSSDKINKNYRNFIRVDTKSVDDTKYFVNKLFNPKKINRFISASPLFISSLVPKIRIYKVISYEEKNWPIFTEKSHSKLSVSSTKRSSYSFLVPFEDGLNFNNLSDIDFSKEYGKSYGAGIESININDASSIETPTNITTDMKLKFSSFDLLFKKFILTSEEDKDIKAIFSFKDLFSRSAASADQATGTFTESVDEHSFKIKLEIGWSFNHKLLKRINYGSTSLTKDDIEDIKIALENCSYTYILGYKNFNVNIEESGLVRANIEYVSSLQQLFSSKIANVIYIKDADGSALSYDNLVKSINELSALKNQYEDNKNIKEYDQRVKKDVDQLIKNIDNDIKKIDKKLKKDYYDLHKQFFTQLFKDSRIFSIKIPIKDIQELKNNYFKIKQQPATMFKANLNYSKLNIAPINNVSEVDVDNILKESLAVNASDIPKADNREISFIFLGDILEYIFGSLNVKESEEFRNCIPIVGNFCYEDINSITINENKEIIRKDSKVNVFNYCDLPISLERFKKFLFEEFVSKQVQVKTLQDFLKQLFTNVIYYAFQGNIFGEQLKNYIGSLITGQSNLRTYFTADIEKEYFTGAEYKKILNREIDLNPVNIQTFDAKQNYKPAASQETLTKSHLVNYFYMFGKDYEVANLKVLDFANRDSYGIVNINIGEDKGLVKKVNFSKNNKIDMAPSMFIEKRAASKANPFLLQGLMNADIEMFGNTFFKAGGMLYIDPTFMLKIPSVSSQEVREFGLGGYYYVTKINHEIGNGKFTTKVTAQFNHNITNTTKPTIPTTISLPKELNYQAALEQYQKLNALVPDDTSDVDNKTNEAKNGSNISKGDKKEDTSNNTKKNK